MPFPRALGTIRATVQGLFTSGESWVNIWHAKTAANTEPTDAEMESFGNALRQFYVSTSSQRSTQWTADRVALRSMTEEDRPTLTQVWVGVAGILAATPLPAQVAMVLTLKHAPVLGKPRYGRTYQNGYTEDGNEGIGRPTALVGSNLRAAGDQLRADVTTAIGDLVIASRTVLTPDGQHYRTWRVDDVSTDNVWDTQRSRARSLVRTRTT